MTIKPDKSRAKRYAITAYDFEWHPDTLEITLAAAYDERGYKWFQDVKGFMNWALTPGNAGRRFYAHFGGASDMIFLLKEFVKDARLQIKGVFSGSSAILVSVKRGEHEWQFIDSFWLMRVPLWKIGVWLGLPKLKIDFRNQTLAELKTYNERDCKILFDAINALQDTILDRGGQLGVTAASTAMRLFLRQYLKRPIKNSIDIDNFTRPAYVASRVERFGESCERAHYFDINSSFPYSMTFPCPGNLQKTHHGKLPQGADFDGLWLADVTVKVPEQYVPPLPYRHPIDDRVFFPTGTWRARLTSEDFKNGDFEIVDVHASWTFEDRDDLSQFAQDFYKLRQEGGFEAEVYKIVLNAPRPLAA